MFALVLLLMPPAAWADATSTADVVNGDTLQMQGQVVKLYGIDALEPDEICLNGNRPWPCGQEAANSLSAYIGGQPIRCQTIRNMSGYILAVCDLNGDDLAGWMVSNGWAFADRSISSDYVPNEEAAKIDGLGVWSSEFVTPWDWREGKRLKLPETPQTEQEEHHDDDPNLPSYGPLNMAP
ncbi:MAG: thermonuclease family protein [Alphaproteobacteria bacterium]|nr:thermonuclease family protein [Alphaproteobacteria bacterium]